MKEKDTYPIYNASSSSTTYNISENTNSLDILLEQNINDIPIISKTNIKKSGILKSLRGEMKSGK